MGPFNHLSLAYIHLSPVVWVPKSDWGWRMITHLSYPKSSGINSFIDPDLCAVQYALFDGESDMIAKLGPGTLQAKMDINRAFGWYRSTQVNLIAINGSYYIDKCLPMGCSVSWKIWKHLQHFYIRYPSTRLVWIHSHYLDDFIFVGKSGLCHTYFSVWIPC